MSTFATVGAVSIMTASPTTTAATITTTATRNGKGKNKRSSIACKNCHASKTKCDVSAHGRPCSRCAERGSADCELIESRRGTYDRKVWLKNVKARKEKEELHRRQVPMLVDITGDCRSPSSSSSLSDGSSSPPLPPPVIEPIQHAAAFEKPKWNMRSESWSNSVGWSTTHKDAVNHVNDCPTHLTAAKIAFLSREGCFTKPDRVVLDRLIAAYFDRVDPVLPIIQRTEFMFLYDADKLSWLLFQSVCFAASTHCSLNIICGGCCPDRHEWRMRFYRRAKSLFDFGYEKDRLTLLQSAILLSYWGGSPLDYWNTFSWLNVAVNIAESLGMHRHRLSPVSADSGRQLWKRIWWVLVVRDSFCASLLGKSLRINTSQCAVDPLQLEDFELDNDQGIYMIETAKLSMIHRDIVLARSASSVAESFIAVTLERLENWRASLPSCLSLATYPPTSAHHNILASSLSLIYYYNLIYLHQVADVAPTPAIAQDALSQILEIGSNIVTRSELAMLPQDAFGAFFMAMVLLFTCLVMKTGDVSLRKMQLNVCEMVVYQAQDCWDHADWILPLCNGLRHKIDGVSPPATSSTKLETEANSFSIDIELDSLFSSLGMHLALAAADNSAENEVVEPIESASPGSVLLSGSETELNVFNDMDDLFVDMDTISNVLVM
ncbi:fungal-specific transcription factor domain-containing protein [Lipomyces kononenkoae]|uniref:Fungal-specific transcription factor domain-containing protein n=1 Tax=Lipomyces kononenkoae TaxID=34357 RepID=A0ACC3SSJ0_LIPKO